MRTNDPRVITSIRFLGCLSAAGAIGFALAACSSSTHLDPPGASATGTGSGASSSATTGSGGSGGGGPAPACSSNPDCDAYPKTVCDTIANECVECLVNSDCAQSEKGPACVGGSCGCAEKAETFCPAPNGSKQCVDTTKSQTDCGSCGHACFGACAAGKCAEPWEPTSLVGAPDPRSRHVAVWADGKMIVWGGRMAGGVTSTGGIYDLATNTWSPTSMANAPSGRVDATAVWDDVAKSMIVWGGHTTVNGGTPLNSGAIYDPAKNVWKTIAVDASTPSPRWGHTAVWTTGITSPKMIVWGGTDGLMPALDGALFDPTTATWESITTFGGGRYDHSATWTGTNMFVWGGFGNDDGVTPPAYLSSGAIYEPGLKAWTTLIASSPPTARSQASAVWTGTSTVVWGGLDGMYPTTGNKYSNGSWYPISNPAPAGRIGHSAAWLMTTAMTGTMIIWGGSNAGGNLDSGYTFNETSLDWSKPLPTAPTARARHSTVVNGKGGSKMIIWGGDVSVGNGFTNTGAIFDAAKM